jgi:nucleotide-binding universal stress UspA family protein
VRPPKTIIVGLDFTEASEPAAALAQAYAAAHGARLVLLHASGLTDDAVQAHDEALKLSAPWAEYVADRLRRAEELLDESAQRCRDRGLAVTTKLVHGFADAVLIAAAHDLRADLLIVGTHGRTGTDRWLLGSVAERIARLAPCNVLIARPGEEADGADAHARTPTRILVASDFSESAERALGAALALAGADAVIEVLHAFHPPAYYGLPAPAEIVSQMRERAIHRAGALLREHAHRGLRVEIVDGAPVEEVLAALERHEHELLVVGSHGHRGVRRLILGSVAGALTRRSPCSVLVVHA